MTPELNQPLSQLEQALAVELAVDVAIWADKGGYDRPDGAMFDGYGHHFHQGPFDTACATLWRLGVAVATDGDPMKIDLPYPTDVDSSNRDPAFFKFFPEKHIRSVLVQRPVESRKWYCWLIDDWLSFAFEYQGLTETRALFAAEERFYHSLRAFVKCGLAIECEGKFAWTGAMTQHMQNAGYWNDDGCSADDQFEEDFIAFVRSLPDSWRYEMVRLAQKSHSSLIFIDQFRRDFEEYGWSKHFRLKPSPMMLGLKLFEFFGGRR